MANQLWYPECFGECPEDCAPVVGAVGCPCCGNFEYDPDAFEIPPGYPYGGPSQWKLTVGSVTGACLGQSCSPASGVHYLDWDINLVLAGNPQHCVWISPGFTLCNAAPSTCAEPCGPDNPDVDCQFFFTRNCKCFAWLLQFTGWPSCPGNPMYREGIVLNLANVCSGVSLIEYANTCDSGGVLAPCDPVIEYHCKEEPQILTKYSELGLCFAPGTVTLEAVYS